MARGDFARHERFLHVGHFKEWVGVVAFGLFESLTLEGYVGAKTQIAAEARGDGGGVELAAVPLHVNDKSASAHESVDFAIAPLVRECGEQVQGTVVALHQHLGHAGCVAEVAVNLERGVCVKQVGVYASAQHVVDDGVGVVAVLRTVCRWPG